VRARYAASFARPGGNVTGLFLDQPSLAGKWIDLLREAAPQTERLAILWDASTGTDQLEVARAVCRTRGFEAVVLELATIRDFDQSLRALAGRPRTGIVQLTSPGFTAVVEPFVAAARKHHLPAISFLKIYARAGVLMTYGPDQAEYFVRAAGVADKILRGAKPGEVAIEGPDRFELVINLGTARALGLTLPQTLMLRADEVIERERACQGLNIGLPFVLLRFPTIRSWIPSRFPARASWSSPRPCASMPKSCPDRSCRCATWMARSACGPWRARPP